MICGIDHYLLTILVMFVFNSYCTLCYVLTVRWNDSIDLCRDLSSVQSETIDLKQLELDIEEILSRKKVCDDCYS